MKYFQNENGKHKLLSLAIEDAIQSQENLKISEVLADLLEVLYDKDLLSLSDISLIVNQSIEQIYSDE